VKRPNPMHAAYAASKAALEAASKAAAIDFGRQGVRVNVVQLGLTDTDALHELLPAGLTLEDMGRLFVPIGRVSKVSEVAAMCLLLAGDAAAAVNGAVITIDGGGTAGTFEARPERIPG
jgi:meso-butanediol dehydrogenase / (S,S)-butanediol dehydrogenase / diacetyl reductase